MNSLMMRMMKSLYRNHLVMKNLNNDSFEFLDYFERVILLE